MIYHSVCMDTCFFRTALLFAHGDLRWDKFHILISRSTTPDLVKIVSKLDEFIMQQFTSSKRALGAMGSITSSVKQKLHEKHKSADEDSCKLPVSESLRRQKLVTYFDTKGLAKNIITEIKFQNTCKSKRYLKVCMKMASKSSKKYCYGLTLCYVNVFC